MSSSHVALVVNPRAGKGRVGRELPRLANIIEGRGSHPEILLTEHGGHAVELARDAARRGADTIVAVGGDGTVNEVVNGMISDDRPVGTSRFAVIAAGSGCDFARSFDLPKDVDDHLGAFDGPLRPLDVGRIDCAARDGGTTIRYFVNIAEAGMAAATVARASQYPRWMGRSRYVVAFWPSLARFKPVKLNVSTTNGSFTGVAHNALVANARYFGGGMHISPHSNPSDGLFDAQVSIGPKRQAFTMIPRFFRGTHLPDPRIIQLTATAFRIEAERPIPVEADGEVVGETPATFTVLPGVLQLLA
ncbi:MAG: hypothetical protein A2Z12_03355 [Actinobacteria bacterium RBG_16_68_21]|nr:MAG: hypothetical protein A2Z12_03355 [Actinobacteria bacterium RBG_16_68_21]